MRKLLKNIFKYYGYEIIKPNLRNDHFKRRLKLIKNYNIDEVLDVGANIGQYGKIMRKIGFEGKIISFEPLKECFQELIEAIEMDKNWTAFNYALGNFDGSTTINIAGNRESSSILEMLPDHLKHRPSSKFIGQKKIQIYKLDTIFERFYELNEMIFLKIDAQGFEYNILEGAVESLPFIQGIQIEMSIEPLYNKEKKMCEMINYLSEKGFKLMSIEPGAVNSNNGQMFQVDGIFFRV